MAAFVAWAILVVLFHRYVYAAEVPSTVHTLLGVALGLLLVFRTNSAYDRFWEGRTAWGEIVNDSRNLARTSSAFLSPDSNAVEPIILWAIAFAYASMHSLRGYCDLGSIAERLPREEVAVVLNAAHVPSAVAGRIKALLVAAVSRGELTDYRLVALDGNLQALIVHLGAAERVKTTPLPFAYVVHLRRALVLYCLTLPFALVGQFGWSTVLYTLLFTYVFCGIEKIGVEIENPFGTDLNDLPLERLCKSLEQDLLGVLEERDVWLGRAGG